MADSTLTLATTRTRVYEELGSPATDLPDVSGGALDAKIGLAVKRILQRIGNRTAGEDVQKGTFATVADQQAYTIPDDQQIVEVFWGPEEGTDIDTDIYARQFANIPNSSLSDQYGGTGFYWHSDLVSHDMRRAQQSSRYQWDIVGGLIYLYPVPTTDLTVHYLYYPVSTDITQLDTKYEEPLIYLAAAYGSRVIANAQRGRGTSFTQAGISTQDNAPGWDERYTRYINEFTRAMDEMLY